tara:strand:- start:168 stop:323 length:156 start_codon:yes stop_codon:yes gene_type:complete
MSNLKTEAQLINEKYPDSPISGKVRRLLGKMRVQHREVISEEQCIKALEEE